MSKRTDYLSRDEYFMGIVHLSAQRSKDPSTQVGACIVNDEKVIVGTGYNGFPRWCEDDAFPRWKSDNFLDNRNTYVVHAEVNAILNANAAVKWCTIYIGLFPCNECAKIIIQSGIKKIIYFSDKNQHNDYYIASKRMLDATWVEYIQFDGAGKWCLTTST